MQHTASAQPHDVCVHAYTTHAAFEVRVLLQSVTKEDDTPSATQIREVTSQGPSPKVHQTKDGSKVGSLDNGEAKLVSKVRRKHIVNGQLHTRKSKSDAEHG